MLSETATLRSFLAGDRIYDDNSYHHALGIVASGSVVFTALAASGRTTVLALLGQGAWFGDTAVSTDLPRVMNVDAYSDATILEVPGTLLREKLEEEPKAALHVLECLGQRFWGIMTLFQDDVVYSIPIRLARRLVLMNRFQAEPTTGDQIKLRMTQEDLASMMGLTRQGLRPALRMFEQKGLMQFSYGVLHIPSLAQLNAYLEDENAAILRS